MLNLFLTEKGVDKPDRRVSNVILGYGWGAQSEHLYHAGAGAIVKTAVQRPQKSRPEGRL